VESVLSTIKSAYTETDTSELLVEGRCRLTGVQASRMAYKPKIGIRFYDATSDDGSDVILQLNLGEIES
ncbi:uncharacterized protein METZ01_LOCUS364628, partial [marine metagenome]